MCIVFLNLSCRNSLMVLQLHTAFSAEREFDLIFDGINARKQQLQESSVVIAAVQTVR